LASAAGDDAARDWEARGYDVEATVAPYDDSPALCGVVPPVRARRDHREVIVLITTRAGRPIGGKASDAPPTPLLYLFERTALFDWAKRAPGRELHWVIVPGVG
jgi:hypothetical protein